MLFPALSLVLPALTGSIAHAGDLRPDVRSTLDAGWEQLKRGDTDGARQSARAALRIPGAHDQEASFLMGRAWQIDGYADDARQLFESAQRQQPHGAFTDHLAFHLAQAIGDTLPEGREGRRQARAARRLLSDAKGDRDLGIVDEARFDLVGAMIDLQAADRPRRLKRATASLLDTLEEVDHDLATWHQAKARTLLVTTYLDLADQLGTEPELLERRAVLLDGARAQLMETIHLRHHDFTLSQLLRLGQAYEILGDDVVSVHGDLSALTEADRKRVETVWVKATRFYDMGERHAAETARSDALPQFADARALVVAKVDAL
jgi:hypothetical protein